MKRMRWAGDPALVAGVVFAASLYGILTRPIGFLAAFWPANALLLGLMVRNPRLAAPAGWLAAAAGYAAADLATGGALWPTLWLSAANLVFVAAGYALFRRQEEESRLLQSPLSFLRLFAICMAAALAAAAAGSGAAQILLGKKWATGFGFWFSTELANAIVILPVLLTAPGWKEFVQQIRQFGSAEKLGWRKTGPVAALAVSLAGAHLVGGPGVIAFPLPALLWCALSYSLFASAALAMLVCVWMMIAISAGVLRVPLGGDFIQSMISTRLGITLLALAPLTVASINAARNKLLAGEREAAEKLKAAKEAAEAAERAKSEFLAVMSHEIRTPLNGVIGMSGLMMQTPLNPDQKEMGRVIQHSSESLLRIINDVLDFSKIEAGKLKITPARFYLRPLIEETMALMAFEAGRKNIKLDLQFDPALDTPLWGDDGRIRQALANLVSNAVKFTAHGAVTVTARRASSSEEQMALMIVVQDTGIGIPLEAQARLFQPFIQADGAVARSFGGTGLGLSISRQLIQLMGGEIGCNSEPGRGSEFWFSLVLGRCPEDSAAPAPKNDSLPGPNSESPLRLLVVDDDVINQMVARRLAAALGHQAEVVSSGEEALEELARSAYDAVLMDCQMPGLNGYETTRRIRAGAGGINSRLHIIALTASAMASDRASCFIAGMNDFVSKPIRAEDMRAALERAGLAAGPRPAPPAPEPEESLLDAAVLEQMRRLPGQNGLTLMAEIAGMFLRSMPDELEKLRQLAAARDAQGAARLSHTLAGSCAATGAQRMRTLLVKLEKTAAAENWNDASGALEALNTAWLETKAALEAETAPQGPP